MMQHTDRTTPNNDFGRPAAGARRRLHDVIFGIHTPAGRGFDIALISLTAVSVLVVMIDSVSDIHAQHGALLASECLFIRQWKCPSSGPSTSRNANDTDAKD